jgi:DNA-binding response OmpR family regulator
MWKLLLIEDEPGVLRLFKEILEMSGFAVQTATSAESGTDLLRQDSFDAVVTDLRMESPLAGYSVVRLAASLAPRPVIVIVTAFPIPRNEWRRSGADALFVKGMGVTSLGKDVRRLVQKKSERSHRPNDFSSHSRI